MGSTLMQNLSNTKLLPILVKLFVLLLVAKIIGLLVWWYLPSEGVELNAKKSYQAKYQRVDFKNMLVRAKVVKETKPQEQTSTAAFSINSLLLKGLYGSKFSGFAILAKKSSPNMTTIVSTGEVYAGYQLKEIALQEVYFTKGGKDYALALPKTSQKSYVKAVRKSQHSVNANDTENEKTVTKQDIKYYSSNPSRIWKDIAIAPVKKFGKIVGFKVNRIKRGSKMATLGLHKGDIMIRANNIKLTSFNDAINLYKKIDTIDTIAIVVLRNNEEKEIIYEIH